MDNLRANPALQLVLAILAFVVPWGGMLIAGLLIMALSRDPRYDTLSKIAWVLAWISLVMGLIGLVFTVLGLALGIALFPLRLLFGLF